MTPHPITRMQYVYDAALFTVKRKGTRWMDKVFILEQWNFI